MGNPVDTIKLEVDLLEKEFGQIAEEVSKASGWTQSLWSGQRYSAAHMQAKVVLAAATRLVETAAKISVLEAVLTGQKP